MTQFLSVFYSVFQIWVLIAVGFITRRYGSWGDEFFKGLSRFLVRVALPIYFMARFARLDLATWRQIAIMPVTALVVVAIGLTVSVVLFWFLPFRGGDRRAGIAMAAFGNSGYIPLALAEILSVTNPAIAARFDVAEPLLLIGAFVGGYSPLLWGVGGTILISHSETGSKFNWKKLISPPVVGIAIGLFFALAGIMQFEENTLLPIRYLFAAADKLAAITMPLALINLGAIIGGLVITRRSLQKFLGVAASVAIVRLILVPGVFFLLWYLGALAWAGPAVLFVIFLEFHIPPATSLSLIATESGINRDHTAVTLMITYALYMVMMPIFLGLFLTITPG